MGTNPIEEYFDKGAWGFNGSVWRKQPLIWSYSGLTGENLSDTNLDAGDNLINGAAVPAGEVWVITAVSMKYVGTAPSSLQCYTVGTPGTVTLLAEYTIVSDQWYNERVWVPLAVGDYLRAAVGGATATDDMYCYYGGYKMTVG